MFMFLLVVLLSCKATGRLVGLSFELGILNPWSVGEGVEALEFLPIPGGPWPPPPPPPPSVSEPGGEGLSDEEAPFFPPAG